jgi:hypothetical protein
MRLLSLGLYDISTHHWYVCVFAQTCRTATVLVKMAIAKMKEDGCSEATLETEVSNASALRFYERLGFIRAKRLGKYYLNGLDAYRLKGMNTFLYFVSWIVGFLTHSFTIPCFIQYIQHPFDLIERLIC